MAETLIRGVGYTSSGISKAGGRFYAMDQTAHPALETPGSVAEQEAMFRRYGPEWRSGVAGPHVPDYAQYLAERFATRQITWPMSRPAQDYDGVPTAEEVTDAYYSGDGRLPLRGTIPAPAPTDPSPVPPPPVPGPPAPDREYIPVPVIPLEIFTTVTSATNYLVNGPGRRARMQRALELLDSLENQLWALNKKLNGAVH